MATRYLFALLVTALAASPSLAQSDAPTKGKDQKPVAASTKGLQATEFSLQVAGLTPDNATKAKSALTSLSIKEYECPGCGQVSAKAGTCSGCEEELELQNRPLFTQVTATPEKGALSLVLAPGMTIRLSTIENALKTLSIQLPRDTMQIPGNATLVFVGGASKDGATELQKLFRDAKFTETESTFDATTKETLVRAGKGPVGWSNAATLGSKTTTGPLRLSDVILGQAGPRRAS